MCPVWTTDKKTGAALGNLPAIHFTFRTDRNVCLPETRFLPVVYNALAFSTSTIALLMRSIAFA